MRSPIQFTREISPITAREKSVTWGDEPQRFTYSSNFGNVAVDRGLTVGSAGNQGIGRTVLRPEFAAWGLHMSMEVTFFGVRGSTPCSSDNHQRYGGNTACVVVERAGHEPIILDLGTGLRFFGLERAHQDPFKASALVSHLHWDHVQGIPFFTPLLSEGARLDLYGPSQASASLQETVRSFLSPPYFPVDLHELPCQIEFHELSGSTFEIDGASVSSAEVPHVGPTLGFRIECEGTSIAYVSDHQQPGVGSDHVPEAVLELAGDVDLLIHDAQFDDLEFSLRHDWGHCTVDYAVEVAAQSGAKTLALFHHDPSHHDSHIDELLAGACSMAEQRGVPEVIAAHEGLTVSLAHQPLEQPVHP